MEAQIKREKHRSQAKTRVCAQDNALNRSDLSQISNLRLAAIEKFQHILKFLNNFR